MSKDSLQVVRDLANILRDTDLSEIEYEQNNVRIKVAKGYPAGVTYAPIPVATQNNEACLLTNSDNKSTSEQTVSNENHPGLVKSPMVGIAYLSPSTDAAPFVQLGSSVTKGQTILIIEAMKVYNMIKAPKDGVIKNILVNNEDPIEYDQGLFIIE